MRVLQQRVSSPPLDSCSAAFAFRSPTHSLALTHLTQLHKRRTELRAQQTPPFPALLSSSTRDVVCRRRCCRSAVATVAGRHRHTHQQRSATHTRRPGGALEWTGSHRATGALLLWLCMQLHHPSPSSHPEDHPLCLVSCNTTTGKVAQHWLGLRRTDCGRHNGAALCSVLLQARRTSALVCGRKDMCATHSTRSINGIMRSSSRRVRSEMK